MVSLVFPFEYSRQRSLEFPRGDSVRQTANLVVMVVDSRQATSVVFDPMPVLTPALPLLGLPVFSPEF